MHYNSPLRPGRSKIELDQSVRDCVHKHAAASGVLWGMPPQTIFTFDALRSLLRPFLDPSSALFAALGRLRQCHDYSATQPRGYM